MALHVREWLHTLAAIYAEQNRLWDRHIDRMQPWLDDPLPGAVPLQWRRTALGWRLHGSVLPGDPPPRR